MTNAQTVPGLHEEALRLLKTFFEKTNANELGDTLSLLLDAHIQHGDFDRLNLSNTVILITDLQKLAFNLEHLKFKKAQLLKAIPLTHFQN